MQIEGATDYGIGRFDVFPRVGRWVHDGLDPHESEPGSAQVSKVGDASTAAQHDGGQSSIYDVVPAVLLVPPDYPIRSGSRTDAGLVLDRELVRLAGMDARCRLVQARLTRRLLETRAWLPNGFVRLSDYARERLGCSPRTLEEDARVLRLLDALPRIRALLESGSASWTSARLLVRIATPDNEESILQRTAGMSSRALESFVRDFGASNGGHGCRSAADTGSRAIAAEQPGEPELRWSIPVSPRGQRAWRAACEIASRTAGNPLSSAQVLEMIVAEASSGEPQHTGDDPPWMQSFEEHEARFHRRLGYDVRRGRSYLEAFLADTGVVEGFSWLDPARHEPGPSERLDALTGSLESANAAELDRRLREVRRVSQRIDYQLATLLRIGVDRRLFREIGFATVKLYVESRLGISSRRVWSLITIERMSWHRCKHLREAWREGRISYLAACTLLPVINEIHGEAWIRRAGEITLRRLADEVAWALDNGERSQPAPPPTDAVVPVGGVSSVDLQEVQMRAHGDDPRGCWRCPGKGRLVVRVPVSVAALLEMQLERYRRTDEERWRTFERLVCLAILEWSSVQRHRDPVFDRDGWRCAVPGCSSRRNLHDHHVVFRSQGGGNSRDNRITVCASHHLHGIHAGIVRAEGHAPDGIEWTMPLMRTCGDRYAA